MVFYAQSTIKVISWPQKKKKMKKKRWKKQKKQTKKKKQRRSTEEDSEPIGGHVRQVAGWRG